MFVSAVSALPNPGSWSLQGEQRRAAAGKLGSVSDATDLVSRCQEGDRLAFRELFEQHREQVARLARRMGAQRTDVEDLVQEVFLQVHRSIGDFKGQSRLTTWLYRVTVNVVLMHRRARRSRPVLLAEELSMPPTDPAALPDEQVARMERIDAFHRLLDRLSEKKRTVYVLHELEAMAPSDIADIVGAPILTVRTRLFYARRELARMLIDEPSLAGLSMVPATNPQAAALAHSLPKGSAG
jgi:RNA polymerase sigma-70 factor (ECF subfamily)